MTTLMTVFLIVSLALGGTGAVVYAAQDDLPTGSLYSVKTFSEDVRLGLTADPGARVQLSLEFANRRAAEIESLSAAGIAAPDPVAARMQAELDNALQVAAGMDDMGMNHALTQVRAAVEQQTQRMEMAQANAPEQAQPVLAQVRAMLAERRTLAQLGLTDPLTFRARERIRASELVATPAHTPGGGIGPGPGISQTVTPGNGFGPGPGISLTVAPGNGFGPGPGISLTVTPSGTFGPGPGISLTVAPGNGFGPGPGISQTVTPGNGFGPGPGDTPQVTPEPGGGNGGEPQPTSEPGGSGDPQATPAPGGDGNGTGNPQATPAPGGGSGGNPALTPAPGGGGSGGSGRP